MKNRLLFYHYLARQTVPDCFSSAELHGIVTISCKRGETPGVSMATSSELEGDASLTVDIMRVPINVV